MLVFIDKSEKVICFCNLKLISQIYSESVEVNLPSCSMCAKMKILSVDKSDVGLFHECDYIKIKIVILPLYGILI